MCKRATAVGAASNAFLCVSKLCLGTAGHSVSLVADGLHAAVDVVSDGVSYAAVALSTRRFPRCQFPFGVGRFETVGSTIVAGILLAGGLSLMWSCAAKILDYCSPHQDHKSRGDECHHHGHGHSHHGHGGVGHSHVELTAIDESTGQELILWSMVGLCVASIVGKEMLFRWTKRVGERAGSRVTVANAYHHRADSWSAGVALVGVGGMSVGVPLADTVAGTLVALTVTNIGARLLLRSVLEFFDYQQADTVRGLAAAVRGVTDRLPIVNVFGTRHGHAFILHATLVVAPHTSAAACACMRDELQESASRALRVSEVFTTLLVVDRNDTNTITAALREVVGFHGADQMHKDPVFDFRNKIVYISDEFVLQKGENDSTSINGLNESRTRKSESKEGDEPAAFVNCCQREIAVVAAVCGLRCMPLSSLPR
jgi:divalent metal cation (Fe/Co/Zn/Cd) transporter